MNEEIALVEKYKAPNKGVLVDANLLLLLVLGTVRPQLIVTNARLASFTHADYDLINGLVAQFKRVVSTPNILTEVSNLANKVTDADKELFHAIFAKVITEVIKTEEYVDSASVANGQPDTWKLGLADAVATKVCMTQEVLLLSTDLQLVGHVQKMGAAALNFNHLRHFPDFAPL